MANPANLSPQGVHDVAECRIFRLYRSVVRLGRAKRPPSIEVIGGAFFAVQCVWPIYTTIIRVHTNLYSSDPVSRLFSNIDTLAGCSKVHTAYKMHEANEGGG